jgi:transcriptional regulator with XRE-family HTH domain
VSAPKIVVDNAERACDISGVLTGEQMRAVRQANGLTQVQLAEMLGVGQGYVADMETGRRRISRRTALAFVAVINAHKDRTSRGRQSQTA